MKQMLCICVLVVALPTLVAADATQHADTTVYVVPPIVVEAKRRDPNADLYSRSGFVAAFDLRERRNRAEDLSAVLSQMVGVKVKQYGGLGDFATVSIRGSSAGQVNVYLDGVPMNDAYTGLTNLADLPLGGVQRVEVYRGFAPPELGAGAIGGAVNLVTADPTRWGRGGLLTGLEFDATYGSYDTSRQLLSAWLQPWRIRVFAHGNHTKSLGNFPFLDDNGTPINLDDNEIADRANNDFESYGAVGRVEADVPGFAAASLTLDAYAREQGVAGIGSRQSKTARYERRRGLGHARLESNPFFFNQLVFGGRAFYSQTNEKFRNLDRALALGDQDTDNTIRSWGTLVRGQWFVPMMPLVLNAVAEQRTDEFHPVDNLKETEGPDRWRLTRTAVLSGDVYLIRQTLVLNATQRWVRHTNEFWDDAPFPALPPSPRGLFTRDNRSPSAGFRWTPVRALMIKGNIGRYQRLPTFLELFGSLGTVTGNADLEPESGLNRDLGVVVNLGRRGWLTRLYVEAVYLDNEASNLILFFTNSQQTTKPVNIGSARIRGWEFSFAAGIGAGVQISGNYTRLDTEDTSDIPYYNGNQLAGRPRDDASLAASYRSQWWKATWEAHLIGPNFLDLANMHEVPARNIHNAIVQAFTPVPGLSLSIEVRNVTNDRVRDVSGFPLPGRSLFTTLSYKR
jgi:iron complex outermembrane receptor protein